MLKRFLKICLTLAVFSSPSFSFQANSSSLVTDNPKEIIDQVWQIIYRDFLDYSGKYNVDEWIELRKQILSNKYLDNEDAYIVIKDMLTKLDDPYTRFLDPKEFNEMRIDTTGELMGIGIQISLDEATNQIVVVTPIEGTPAFFAGIKPKDIIVSIDGKSIKGFSIDNGFENEISFGIKYESGSTTYYFLNVTEKTLNVHVFNAFSPAEDVILNKVKFDKVGENMKNSKDLNDKVMMSIVKYATENFSVKYLGAVKGNCK